MSEEEKEAIEVLKEMQEICKRKTYIENEERSEWQREYKAVDTILSLIDKQQKEIKEKDKVIDYLYEAIKKLQKENKELQECLEAEEKYSEGLNRDIKSLLNIEPNTNFISKDKIRENIDTKINIVIDDRLNSKDAIQIAIDKGIEELLKMIRQELLGE